MNKKPEHDKKVDEKEKELEKLDVKYQKPELKNHGKLKSTASYTVYTYKTYSF